MTELIIAIIKETVRLRCDERGVGGEVFDHRPTPQEVADHFLSKGRILPYDQVQETEASAHEEGGKWHGSVYQWNWLDAVREVTLRIPRDEVPADYTPDDLIAWGKERGKTDRKALGEGVCEVVSAHVEAARPPGIPAGMVQAAPRAEPAPRTFRSKLAALGGSIADLFRRA